MTLYCIGCKIFDEKSKALRKTKNGNYNKNY